MERRRFDIELEKLQAKEFGNDIEALNELCRFAMFASACGYRGKVIQLAVQDKRIVLWPYGEPKPTLKKEENSQQITTEEAISTIQEIADGLKAKPLLRQGGPKPRALKREAKKGKVKKRKSRTSSGYRH